MGRDDTMGTRLLLLAVAVATATVGLWGAWALGRWEDWLARRPNVWWLVAGLVAAVLALSGLFWAGALATRPR